MKKYCTEKDYEGLETEIMNMKGGNDTFCNVCNSNRFITNKSIMCTACLYCFTIRMCKYHRGSRGRLVLHGKKCITISF